jgi:hypothetical protein
MQEHTEPESKINYWYKQYLKAPAQLVGFGALIALFFVYQNSRDDDREFREYMAGQQERALVQNEKLFEQNEKLLIRIEEETRTISKIGTQIELLNNRLGHVERELEIKRKDNE